MSESPEILNKLLELKANISIHDGLGLQALVDFEKQLSYLVKENERLREALKSVLGWRELRSHDEIPIGRIEEICTEALSTNEKPSGGEPKKRCLTDLGYRTPLPDSLLSDDGERRMAMRISPKEGE